MRRSCVWFRKGEERKVTNSAGENEVEIDFVLMERIEGYPR